MSIKYLIINLTVVVAIVAAQNSFLDEFLTVTEHESLLTEDLARLLKIDYERQGACGSEVSSECCSSCSVDGICYNGGVCCEIRKVRTRLLKSGEDSCPSRWGSDCQLTQMVPIESGEESDSGSSSSSSSSEDRQLDKSGFRLMCVCVSSKRCCSDAVATTAPVYTTTPYPYYYYYT